MPSKTKLDLFISAHSAVLSTVTAQTAYDLEKAKMAAFDASGFEQADFQDWNGFFVNFANQNRNTMLALAKQPLLSTTLKPAEPVVATKATAPAPAAGATKATT